MALKIRLRQQGRTNHTTYRLVVMDTRHPRDGKYIEMLGWSRPFQKKGEAESVDGERIQYWLSQGAQISDNAKILVRRLAPSVIQAYNQQIEKKKVAIREKRKAARRKKKAKA
jgi:small subunit ribosomal protein S16